MNLQLMRFFVAAADAGSLSAASEKLNYAQSNLSTRIAQLERELGEQLFYRYKRGVTLTAKGRIFYKYAVRILSIAEEAANAVKDQDVAQGNLLLGSLEATALGDLPDLLSAYNAKYPNVSLSLQVDLNDFFQEKVLRHTLDGAFMVSPVSHPSLIEIPFKKDRLIFVGSNSSSPSSPNELLRTARLITFPDGSAFRNRLELLLASQEIPYYDRLIVINSLGVMISNISAGLGYGYLPINVVSRYIQRGLMREYPVESSFSELNISFVYRRDHMNDAAFRYFLQMVRGMGDTEKQIL